jgi:hypothetical protein
MKVESVPYLAGVAVEAARRAGWECLCEQSDRSEATYVKVRRGEFWFGVRIACHEPWYACSADYLQILVPLWVESIEQLADAELRLCEAVVQGGLVIADPTEVDLALHQALATIRERSPGAVLSGASQSAVRTRLNFRARWTFDEMQVLRGLVDAS